MTVAVDSELRYQVDTIIAPHLRGEQAVLDRIGEQLAALVHKVAAEELTVLAAELRPTGTAGRGSFEMAADFLLGRAAELTAFADRDQPNDGAWPPRRGRR